MENELNFLKNDGHSDSTSNELDFLTLPAEMLEAFLKCKEEGTTIGIKSSVLGSGVITTTVDDIIFEDGQTIIVFKQYDTSGYILPAHAIKLSEIEGAHLFATPFINPFLNLSKDNKWFF